MSTGLTRAAEKKRRRDWFRNLRVGTKLAAGFGAIVALLVLTALFAMYSINGISAQIRLYSRYTVPNAEHIRVLQVSLQDIRHLLLAAVVAVLEGTVDHVKLGLPDLSNEELDRLEMLEAEGKARKTLIEAIAEERLRRAEAKVTPPAGGEGGEV